MTSFKAEILPRPAEISSLIDNLGAFLKEADVDERAAHHVALILEEMLTNVATHGGVADRPANVSVTVETGKIIGEVIDEGPLFDPRWAAEPDVNAPVEDRALGGLGLFLMRELAGNIGYVRTDGRNRTTFAIPRSWAGPART